MRLGLRPQLVLALGALLVLAFVPLFFAFASLTRATMSSDRQASARALGRAVAGHPLAVLAARPDTEMGPMLEAQLGDEGVAAIAAYDAAGERQAMAGDADARSALPARLAARGQEESRRVRTERGEALLVVVPKGHARGDASALAAAVVVRTDPSTTHVAPLLRLVALYTAVVALALLVFAYMALTRLILQPIDALAHAASRVEGGARALLGPKRGARELVELGASLSRMTERLRADEEALRTKVAEAERYAADLSRAQAALIRSERLASVGRLSAGLAHEIGNPIAAILGFQELLLEGGLSPEEERDFLERMKRETERIHRILRDLLDFARPAAMSRRPEELARESAGEVAEAVADVLALIKPQKVFRDLELEVELAPELPTVSLSHARLVQVLLNLLLNAADALSSRGSAEGRIVMRARRLDQDQVRIEVEDNGPGISAEIVDRLFEPFVTTKEVGKGTGLGLAVCRGLVEAAGGTIATEGSELGGARFVIELPLAVG